MSDRSDVRQFLESRGCPDDVIESGTAGLVEAWEHAAEQVEGGYPLGLDDYLNDLDGRQLLENLLEAVPGAGTPALEKRLHAADEKMRAATRRVNECLWGSRVAEAEGWNADDHWWYFAVPASPGPELREDLGSRG